jgi:DNA anti-recombination protein RmuC
MSEITKEEMRDRLGNIDQIRDILFGPQLREYDTRFDKIESDLSRLHQETIERVDQVKTAVSTELRTAFDSLDKRLKSLNVSSQNDVTDIRQLLDRINKKFSTNIEDLDKEVDRQTTTIREDLSQSTGKLQEDVRNLRAHIFEELERRFSILREGKVSRDEMAEMMFEVGLKLKKTEFLPELKEAANTSGYTDIILKEK